MRSVGTIVISCDNRTPFELQSLQVLRYRSPSGHFYDTSIAELARKLEEALRSAMEGRIDSPVHALFPTLSVSLPHDPGARQANFLRMRLLNAQRLPGAEAYGEIRAVEKMIYEQAGRDRTLLEDLMLAYRDESAWADVIRVVKGFPPDLRDESLVRQQYALALNRSGDRDAAERELTALIERTGGDSETYGILGRIYNERWLETSGAGPEQAVEAYAAMTATTARITTRGSIWRRCSPCAAMTRPATSSRTSFPACASSWPIAPRPGRQTTGSWPPASAGRPGGSYPAAEALLERGGPGRGPWMLESTAGNLQ